MNLEAIQQAQSKKIISNNEIEPVVSEIQINSNTIINSKKLHQQIELPQSIQMKDHQSKQKQHKEDAIIVKQLPKVPQIEQVKKQNNIEISFKLKPEQKQQAKAIQQESAKKSEQKQANESQVLAKNSKKGSVKQLLAKKSSIKQAVPIKKATLKNSQSKQVKEIATKQNIVKKQGTAKKIPTEGSEIEVEVNYDSFAPIDTNISLIGSLESVCVSDPSLIKYYQSNHLNKFCLMPLHRYKSTQLTKDEKCSQVNKEVLHILYKNETLQKYADLEIKFQNEYIFHWIVQLFYELYIESRNHKLGFIQIKKSDIYVPDSPFLSLIILRNQQYIWNNPLRILITATVINEAQYLKQMEDFGCDLQNIKSIQDLKQAYYKLKYKDYLDEMFSIQNIAKKIKDNLDNKSIDDKKVIDNEQNAILTEDMIKWIYMETNQNPTHKITLFLKASTYNFEPNKFWDAALSHFKTKQRTQLVVIEIQGANSQNKLIGFYSNKFQVPAEQNKQVFRQYIVDNDKKSLLLNISQKTLHHLTDPSYAILYNGKVLLCIGKCDIILSAFNIKNLCYFPVSYGQDQEGICKTAEDLCGGKIFKVKDVYVFRFVKTQ